MTTSKFLPSLLVCCLLAPTLLAQSPVQRCGTMQHLEYLKQQDPGLAARMAEQEQRLENNINSGRFTSAGVANAPLVIRVVVHVVWNTPSQNISDTRVLSQIDVLNEDFNRYNNDAINTPSVFQSVAANTGIHFCLATTDPLGNPTNGINRVQTAVTSFSSNNSVKSTAQGGVDPWDPNTYLNIWVCNLGNGLLGYAQFPGGPLNTSGLVMLYSAFGRNGTIPPYDQGRTATHEMGHLFNLRHVWGDANCGNDLVADTPVQQQGNFGCPNFPHVTCTNGPNGDMFMNYMDYTDDACMNLFTAGQGIRMQAAISTFYPGLISNLDCVSIRQPLSGKVYYDINQNSQNDPGDNGMINQQVLLLPDSTLLTTDSSGNFFTFLDTGSYSIQMTPDPIWNVTQGNSGYSFIIDTLPVCCNDFGLTPVSIFDNVSINYTAGIYRCGFNVPAWITLINDGTSIVSGTIRYVPDDSMIFVSSTPVPDNVSGDTLYYNYTNLYPGQTFSIHLIYELPVAPGLILCSNTYATVFDGTVFQPFTENQYCDTITCSADPNDKKVIPPGVQASHYILKTDSLLYTIRFQNEGNDTAFTVVIRDQLSNLLDRNTMEFVGSSHPVTYSVSSTNFAEFRFENILLPYKSINEAGSQGFVSFRIIPFAGLPDGTVINNDAGIYFDFNAPVITNNTFVTLVTTIPVGINEITGSGSLTISPQPFTDYCEIMIPDESHSIKSFRVFDVSGRKILSGTTSEGKQYQIHLNTSPWDKGIYFIIIDNDNSGSVQTAKLVKQ